MKLLVLSQDEMALMACLLVHVQWPVGDGRPNDPATYEELMWRLWYTDWHVPPRKSIQVNWPERLWD